MNEPRSKGRSGSRYRRLRAHVQRHQKVCYLCGEPIDAELTFPHPYSFSLDHEKPLSHRPDLALDRSNAKAAHLVCNQRKGNRQHDGPPPRSQEW